ncbi:MAG TPA: hypothetical protein VEK07_21015 [Polyangiaceae bacterium]|nr:hypothetical protein [Polyangiaceae bacterium]
MLRRTIAAADDWKEQGGVPRDEGQVSGPTTGGAEAKAAVETPP